MGFEDLTELEILQGSFALIFIIISLILGIRIAFKYFSLKRFELITVGLTWIFMSSSWWGASISFILFIFFGFGLNVFLYLFISNVFLPGALICWIYSFCHLAYPRLKKKMVSIYLVICVIYEIFLIIFLLINPEIIAIMEGKFNTKHQIYTLSFDIFTIISALITGVIFAKISMKSENPVVKLKGKFLLIGFISLMTGAILDAGIPINAITLVLVRILLISSAIEYYMGFLLPSPIANWIENRNK